MQVQKTAIPKTAVEKSVSGSGPVTVSKLPENELQELRNKMVHKSGLSREETLRAIASGEKLAALERRKGMKPNEIYFWLKKWNITGMSPKQAQVILNGSPIEDVGPVQNKPVVEVQQQQQQVSFQKIQLPQETCDALNEWKDKPNTLFAKHSIFDKEIPECILRLTAIEIAQALVVGYEAEPDPTTEEEKQLKKAWGNPPWPIYEMKSDTAYRCGLRDGLAIYGHHFDWMKEK